ncbi:MAG: peptidylprolyl isomerase [Candidatus Omnitrophota bacterium]
MKKTLILFLAFFICRPIAAPAETINKVVAVVNDEVITQQDLDHLLGVLYAQYAQAYKDDELLRMMEEAKKDILNQVIEDKLVLSRARAIGIKVTDAEINEKLEAIKKEFPSEGEFLKTLETQGITVATLKDRYKDQLLMKKAVDMEVRSRVGVLPSEINDYYERRLEEFKRDEKYKVKNILIKASDEVGAELAKVEIDDIYNKLKEGQAFEDLARQKSQGPNAENGGDLGYMEKGRMLEGLDDVIFKLKPGEFSEPVKSEIGYHIFKVDDIQYGRYLALDEVKKDIEIALFREKFRSEIDKWLDDLKGKAYISVK